MSLFFIKSFEFPTNRSSLFHPVSSRYHKNWQISWHRNELTDVRTDEQTYFIAIDKHTRVVTRPRYPLQKGIGIIYFLFFCLTSSGLYLLLDPTERYGCGKRVFLRLFIIIIHARQNKTINESSNRARSTWKAPCVLGYSIPYVISYHSCFYAQEVPTRSDTMTQQPWKICL